MPVMTHGEQLEPPLHAADSQRWLQYPPVHTPLPAAMQKLPWQVAPSVQAEPVADSVWFWQVPEMQVPAVQLLPPQHGWPTTPHATQLPDWHTDCAPHWGAVAQHAWPTPPHDAAWQ
jgi:hypothetical protein